MPRIPPQILELARSHHRELLDLERGTRARLNRRFDAARAVIREELGRISPERFRAQQLRISNLLVELSGDITTAELEGTLAAMREQALVTGTSHAIDELITWADYYGAEARNLNLGALAANELPNLIERHAVSLATWGFEVAERVRSEIATALITRETLDNVTSAVDAAIAGERWRAERIVRTETIHVYNAGHNATLREARDTGQVPGIKKSCIVTFDARTDEDSLPVHGQVRELDEEFVDGDGRRYLHPPGRPNDREKEIPWLDPADAENITPIDEGIETANRERARQNRPPIGLPDDAPSSSSPPPSSAPSSTPEPSPTPSPQPTPSSSEAPATGSVDVVPRVTPSFSSIAEAQAYALDNGLAERVNLRRGWNLEGVREAFDAVQDMGARFGQGELLAIGDQSWFNSEVAPDVGVRLSGGGGANVTAAFGNVGKGVLVIKKQSVDVDGLLASNRESNAGTSALTNVDEMIGHVRQFRRASGDTSEDASARLRALVDDGWQPKFGISNTPQRVVQHELGHRLHEQLGDQDFNAAIRRAYRGGWGNAIGEYANSLEQEYAAEATVAYVQGEWYLLPDDVVRQFQRLDARADDARALAKRKRAQWEAEREARLEQQAEANRVRDAINVEIERVARARASTSSTRRIQRDLELLTETPDEARERLGAGKGNPLADMVFDSWKENRAQAEKRQGKK